MISYIGQTELQQFEYQLPQIIIQNYEITYFNNEDLSYNYYALPCQELLNKYCLWIDSNFWECSQINIIGKSETKEEKIANPKRLPKVKMIDFQTHLQTLIDYFSSFVNSDFPIFTRWIKKPFRVNASAKRTSYFGVNKNGPNWQTLITINKRKTYVGTFMTEVEAARAFDFYSMLLHLDSAKTNFSYNKDQALSLISELSYLIS